MMIGNPDWFERRKYGGWGLHPKNWKGWIYVSVFLVVFLGFQLIPFWDTMTRVIFTIVWGLILFLDTMSIMLNIRKDERERIHEAISERNAVWVMTIILSMGLAYQITLSSLKREILVDWWIVVALVLGLFIKSFSNYYLDKNH